MSEKMTIEKAREIMSQWPVGFSTVIQSTEFHHADGFIEGYESRQAEIEELEKKLHHYMNTDFLPIGSEESK